MDALERVSDTTLKLLWVDRTELSVRGDMPIATMRFFGIAADKLIEQCRIQTSVPHLKAIVDLLCRALEYYPAKLKP